MKLLQFYTLGILNSYELAVTIIWYKLQLVTRSTELSPCDSIQCQLLPVVAFLMWGI